MFIIRNNCIIECINRIQWQCIIYIYLSEKRCLNGLKIFFKRIKIKFDMGNILVKFNYVEILWINLKVFVVFEFIY